jgi:hypothetical protein
MNGMTYLSFSGNLNLDLLLDLMANQGILGQSTEVLNIRLLIAGGNLIWVSLQSNFGGQRQNWLRGISTVILDNGASGFSFHSRPGSAARGLLQKIESDQLFPHR